jgi:hypothetical protein
LVGDDVEGQEENGAKIKRIIALAPDSACLPPSDGWSLLYPPAMGLCIYAS